MSHHGLQHSEVSTTTPIVKAQSATSCESQKQWPNKSKKDCSQPFAGLALVERFWPQFSLHKSEHRQVTVVQGGCLLPEQAPCMRHLRKTVISELQINIWDRSLLISVSLPSKYLFTALILSEENFHHWPLNSAASTWVRLLKVQLMLLGFYLGHFWSATWKRLCRNIRPPWTENEKQHQYPLLLKSQK